MKFLTLFLTVVLTLSNATYAKSAMDTFALQTLRADLLTYGLADMEYRQRIGEVQTGNEEESQQAFEVAQVYPEELTRPLARYLGK